CIYIFYPANCTRRLVCFTQCTISIQHFLISCWTFTPTMVSVGSYLFLLELSQMFIYRSFIAGVIFAVSAVCCAAGPVSIGNLLPTAGGTTLTLAGPAAGWKDPWKPTAPNTFYLTDATGSIRVCVWPDDMAEVPPPVADALKKKGTPVRLTGEVAV